MTRQMWLGSVAGIVATSVLAAPVSAQETSASVRGELVNSSGAAVGAAQVTIRHLPSGTVTTAVSNAQGVFVGRGLRVGGPYEITARVGDLSATVRDVFLTVDDASALRISMQTASEEVVVIGQRNSLGLETGPRSAFDRDTIARSPSIGRDPKDLLRLDPRATVNEAGSISVAGLNQRLNSITLDGIRLNDDFGTNRTNYPGRSSPVSIDAIEQLVLETAPFDAANSNVLGGAINLVTRSGNNDLSGSLYYLYSDQDWAGELPNGAKPDFKDVTRGFTLSGPIIKDRLFGFLSYEDFETQIPQTFGPAGSGFLNQAPNVTQADADRVRRILKDVYNYDAGGFSSSLEEEDKKFLVRIDANISANHRAVASYLFNEGINNNQNGNGAGLQSYWGFRKRTVEAYSAQLFSDWTDRFSTEIRISHKATEDDRTNPLSQGFAEFNIRTPAGGTLFAGPLRFFQNNLTTNKYSQVKVRGEYLLGQHDISFGYDWDKLDVNNGFVFANEGVYTFASIDLLEQRQASSLFYRNAPSGNLRDGFAIWGYDIHALYAQTDWTPRPDLTITAGLRYERYAQQERPALNQTFLARNGFSNQANLDGLDLLMPRTAFNWELNDRTTLRGGAGLFAGGTPNVFYSNGFNNNGVAIVEFSPTASGLASSVYLNNVNGFEIPSAVTTSLRAGVGAVEAIAPGFETPSSWKYSLAVDHNLDLSALGLGDDWRVSLEALLVDVNKGLNWRYLGLTQVGAAPDGRPIYNPATANQDIVLVNTDKGRATTLSVSVDKEFDFGLSLSGGYAWTDTEEVNGALGSLHVDSWQANVTPDYNNPPLSRSAFETKHRFVGSASWTKRFFANLASTATLVGEWRSGQPFSYTYSTGRLFGDPIGRTRSPLYVPSGPGASDDPRVTYAPGFNLAGFNDYLASTGLDKYRGQITPRNDFDTEDVVRFDLRLQQELPGARSGHKTVLWLDIDNVGNLINDKWGTVEAIATDFTDAALAPVGAEIVNGVYRYNTFSAARPSVQGAVSFWKLQVGLRYQF